MSASTSLDAPAEPGVAAIAHRAQKSRQTERHEPDDGRTVLANCQEMDAHFLAQGPRRFREVRGRGPNKPADRSNPF